MPGYVPRNKNAFLGIQNFWVATVKMFCDKLVTLISAKAVLTAFLVDLFRGGWKLAFSITLGFCLPSKHLFWGPVRLGDITVTV